jgi:hypothetical protein
VLIGEWIGDEMRCIVHDRAPVSRIAICLTALIVALASPTSASLGLTVKSSSICRLSHRTAGGTGAGGVSFRTPGGFQSHASPPGLRGSDLRRAAKRWCFGFVMGKSLVIGGLSAAR